jgi:hypothetical protein
MKRVFCAAVAAAAVAAGGLAAPASAKPPIAQEPYGPLATAHPCQDGFNQLVREDGSAFANRGECVSYSAQGGAVIDPLTGESCHLGLGAQRGADPHLLWTCSVVGGTLVERSLKVALLSEMCRRAGGRRFTSDAGGATGPGQASCYRR